MAKTEKSANKGKRISSPDELLKSSKQSQAELTENALDKISGGPIFVNYDKLSSKI